MVERGGYRGGGRDVLNGEPGDEKRGGGKRNWKRRVVKVCGKSREGGGRGGKA